MTAYQSDELFFTNNDVGTRSGALVSRSIGLGSSPGRGHCVVFLDKALYSHNGASLRPGV